MQGKYPLLFLLAIFFTIACNPDHMNSETYTYLALGDSYTIGESVDADQRYPVQLIDSLNKAGLTIDNYNIVAKTGWTTDELLLGIDTAKILKKYDLVTLLIGVNNQYRGRELNNYRNEFLQLLDQAITFAGNDPNRVIVISIPDWGLTPFAKERNVELIAKEIDDFNAVNKEESVKAGAHYVNVTNISRQASKQTELIASDGLHPSGIMYTKWVSEILPIAEKILTKK